MISWRLALRDLRGGLGGLGLLWVCLALAVAGLAAVLSLVAAMDKAIDANSRALLGGDLLLTTAQRPATDEELAAMRDLGPLSISLETRAMVRGGSGATLVELESIDPAYPLAGTLDLEGARPSGSTVAIDRDLADRLDLGVGDAMRIGYADFTVSGIIDDRPGGGGFAFAPGVLVDDEGLARTRLIQPGSLVSYRYRLLLGNGVDPEAAGEAFQSRFADAGWRAVGRENAAGGTQRFVARTGDMLLLIALAALGIGALGIGSASRAFASTRRATVARLKLVGARQSSLAGMLALELGLVMAAALVVGLLAGSLAPPLVGAALGDRLPIAPDPGPHWLALGEASLTGILITIAASWAPLAAALSTRPAALLRGSVEEESGRQPRRWFVPSLAFIAAIAVAIAVASNRILAAQAVGFLIGLTLIFLLLGWLVRRAARLTKHRGGPIQRLGIAALNRPGNATMRLSVALGLGLSLLVALAGVGQSLLEQLESNIPNKAPALFMVDIPAREEANFRALLDAELPDAAVELVPSLRGPVMAVNGTPVAEMENIPEGAWILRGDRGLTFLRDLPAGNQIVSGEWWPADYSGPPLISLDVDAATALGLKVGDSLTIGVMGRPVEARIASLRTIDWRSFGFNFAIIFAPGTLESAPYTLMATVGTVAGTDTRAFERSLADSLPMVSAIRVADIVAEVRSILESLSAAIRIATALAIAMGVIVLAGSVVATRAQRARELVLLRLVGAQKGQLVRSQLIEFFALSSVTALAASGAGILAAWLVCDQLFEIAFEPNWPLMAAIPVGAILLAISAALIAAWPALTARPAQALRAR